MNKPSAKIGVAQAGSAMIVPADHPENIMPSGGGTGKTETVVRCEPTEANPDGIVAFPDFPVHLRNALIALAKGEVTFAQLFPDKPRATKGGVNGG